jgi:hypothetical protein
MQLNYFIMKGPESQLVQQAYNWLQPADFAI